MGKPDTQDIDQIQESLSFPAEIQIKGYLGKGARSYHDYRSLKKWEKRGQDAR